VLAIQVQPYSRAYTYVQVQCNACKRQKRSVRSQRLPARRGRRATQLSSLSIMIHEDAWLHAENAKPTKLAAPQLHISICNVLDREQAQDRLSRLASRLYRDLPPQSCMPEIPPGTDTSNPHVQQPHFDQLSRSLLRFAVAVAGRDRISRELLLGAEPPAGMPRHVHATVWAPPRPCHASAAGAILSPSSHGPGPPCDI
jgi:hypothetical protein